MPLSLDHLRSLLPLTMLAERRRLRTGVETVDIRQRRGQQVDRGLATLERDIRASIERVERRRARLPRPVFPPDLPVVQRKDDIARAIAENQVVVICGETGSGKTTQLPKILLEMGRGVMGTIGHTQPRRIAARSVAARIAEEIGSSLGHAVGYKVRFGDKTTPDTFIKVMTDGILLAEVQGDPLLEQYDTLIIDEAHERSLNIDFLMGIIKRILPQRPDLKLIITSATIDPGRFARHFAPPPKPDQPVTAEPPAAPIIEVSGRMYPVEVRYRPLTAATPDEDAPDIEEAILASVDELSREGPGDILVFLSGERDIREIAEALRKHHPAHTEIVPLYARLSAAEQQKVFEKHRGRRIVLATNVAETSLTVPGIRYVIDPGFARISRYSTRTKVQRLPIEAISQAAADQRKGRCGRVGPGVCIRLYSEEDFAERAPYTEPEVLRTNLANVILQMKAMHLGEVVDFPFVDPPESRSIRDGYETLHELGAVNELGELSVVGQELAKLPVDPRIGRMLVAARDSDCLAEVLILAAALSVQDPRDRPLDKQDAADEAHKRFITIPDAKNGEKGDLKDASDFITLLNMWRAFRTMSDHLSHSKLRKWCHEQFLSFVRMREWQDVHSQLHALVADMWAESKRPDQAGPHRGSAAPPPSNRPRSQSGGGRGDSGGNRGRDRQSARIDGRSDPRAGSAAALALQPSNARTPQQATEDSIHCALLTGLLGNVGIKSEEKDSPPGEYKGTRGTRFFIFPGSALHRQNPKWVMAAEIVQTTRLYSRTMTKVQPIWIERIGAHLVNRSYSEPEWNSDRARVESFEKVVLFGLEIVAKRTIHYGPINPVISRDLFIKHALVEGEFFSRAPFYIHNAELVAEVKALEARSRTPNLLVSAERRQEFFDKRLPQGIYDGGTFDNWRRHAERENPRLLFMTMSDLIDDADAAKITQERFPTTLVLSVRGEGGGRVPLSYKMEPAHPDDGVTAIVPIEAINEIDEDLAEWLVPGMLKEKLIELIRGLPKEYRVRFVPAPEHAERALPLLGPPDKPLTVALAQTLSDLTGVDVPQDAWRPGDLAEHLRMNFAAVDKKGTRVASGRDLVRLKSQLRSRLREALVEIHDARSNRDNIREWDFGALPERVEAVSRGLTIVGYPAIVDAGALPPRASLRLLETPDAAAQASRAGVRRLYAIQVHKELTFLLKNFPGFQRMAMHFATLGTADQFRAELFDAIVDRAFMVDENGVLRPQVRTEAEFRRRLDPGWCSLSSIGNQYARLVEQILAAYQPVASQIGYARKSMQQSSQGKKASQHQLPDAWAHASLDIRDQLDFLLAPGFMVDTPPEWLVHYPRYLAAIRARLLKLQSAGPMRDAKAMSEIEPFWRAWQSAAERAAHDGVTNPELDKLRWMIEELRVSLFAQELRTSLPVSAKRLAEQLAKVRTI